MRPSEVIQKYLGLLESFVTNEDAFTDLLHSDFAQVEYPNALNKKGQKSSRVEVFQRMKMGRAVLSTQSFKIESECVQDDKAAVEALWSGTLAMDAGPLKKGQTLTAHICMCFEFKDGKILTQRNYDCFESF